MAKMEIRDERRFNFTIVDNEILERDELDTYEKLTYIIMCKFAGQKDECFPSRKTLAKYVGCSVKTIDRKISNLVDKGFIKKIKRKTEKGDYTSNIYIIQGVATESRQGGSDTESPPLATESRHRGVTESPELDLNELDSNNNKTSCAASGTHPSEPPFKEIINYFNDKTGRNFKAKSKNTRKLLRDVLAMDYEIADIKEVIDKMVDVWGDSEKWRGYLRPKTIFKPDNFEDYFNTSSDLLKKRYERIDKSDGVNGAGKESKKSDVAKLSDPEHLEKSGWI